MTITEQSHLSTLARLPRATAGRLRLETELTSCFSDGWAAVDLAWSEREIRVDIQGRKDPLTTTLPRDVAMAWVAEVCEALLRPERELGGRSTVVRTGKLVWEGADAEGTFSGHAAWKTSEIDDESIALVVDKRPDIAERARQRYLVAFAMEALVEKITSLARGA